MFMAGALLAGAAAGQGVGQSLAFGVEHPQIAQVRMASGEVQRHGQVHAIPGAFAIKSQLNAGGEVVRLHSGKQWLAEQSQAGQQGQAWAAQARESDHALTRSCSGSARLGGRGAK